MLEDAAGIRRVVLACDTVDLRKVIDGLATIIGDKYGQNPFEKGTLFCFVESVPIGAKDSCGWVPDFCFYINALKQDGYPAKEYPGSSGPDRRTVQVSYDGVKSPESKNQRCRSEKYLLKRLCKTEKIYFLFWYGKELLSLTMDDRIRTIRSPDIRQE